MANMNNLVLQTGRLARDPQKFANKDGSNKLSFTLAVEENFTRRGSNERGVQFIPVEVFLAKDRKPGAWGLIGQGDLISIQGRLVSNQFERNGEAVYQLVLEAEGYPELRESKDVTTARRLSKEAAATPNPAAVAPAAGVQYTPEQIAAAMAVLGQQAGQAPAPAVTGDASETPFA